MSRAFELAPAARASSGGRDFEPELHVVPASGRHPGWKWDKYLPLGVGEDRQPGLPPPKGWEKLQDEDSKSPDQWDWLAKSSLGQGKGTLPGPQVSRYALCVTRTGFNWMPVLCP